MRSTYALAASRRLRSSSHTRSRPRRAWRTRPTLPSVFRCFVIACRVSPVPSLSRVIESGPSTDRRRSRLSRVASPSAANSTGALGLRDIRREVLDLAPPTLGVHAERLGAARERNLVAPRLDDRQRRAAALGILERELDERHGLFRIILGGVLGIRMPAIGEIALRLDPLGPPLPLECVVPAPHRRARDERAVEREAKPRAELFASLSARHTRERGARSTTRFSIRSVLIVILEPLHDAVLFLAAERREIEQVVGVEQRIETALVGRVGVEHAVTVAEKHAQPFPLPFPPPLRARRGALFRTRRARRRAPRRSRVWRAPASARPPGRR